MAIKESQTDVLIIGAGPSGLMCATWLARCGIPLESSTKDPTKCLLVRPMVYKAVR